MRSMLVAAFAVALATVASAAPTTQPSYPLKVDVVTGQPLPTDGSAIVEKIDGREVHFADKDSVAKFKAGGEEMQKKMDGLVADALRPSYTATNCPVSDEKLGEMGKPVEFVDRSTNRLIELCCKSCLKKVQKDPAAASAALAKVDAETAAKK